MGLGIDRKSIGRGGSRGSGTRVYRTPTPVCSASDFSPSHSGRMGKTAGVRAEKGKKEGKALSRQTLEQKKYHILLTNLPQESFDAQQVYELYSLRCQVELLFKGWKSLFDLDRVKKMKKERFECHLYGTLIAILVTKTLLLQARRYWHQREGIEISEWKALNILQSYWHRFLLHPQAMETALPSLLSLLRKHARKDRRKGEETVSDLLKKLGIW